MTDGTPLHRFDNLVRYTQHRCVSEADRDGLIRCVFGKALGRLRKQPVTVGFASDLELEITSGLTEQDQVVSRPDATMKEGMKVKPLEK